MSAHRKMKWTILLDVRRGPTAADDHKHFTLVPESAFLNDPLKAAVVSLHLLLPHVSHTVNFPSLIIINISFSSVTCVAQLTMTVVSCSALNQRFMLQYCIHLSCCIFTSFNGEIEKKRACVANTRQDVWLSCKHNTTQLFSPGCIGSYRSTNNNDVMSPKASAALQISRLFLPGPHVVHEETSGGKRRAAGKAGSHDSARGRLLSFVCCSLHIFVSTSRLFPLSSTCSWRQLCCVARVYASRLCVQRGASRERWPSCCHWVLLQLICSLIASLAFVLFLPQWPSSKETLFPPHRVLSVCCVSLFTCEAPCCSVADDEYRWLLLKKWIRLDC